MAGTLNPDGTLRTDARGSFDATDYAMGTVPDGRPTFRPTGTRGTLDTNDANWTDGFNSPGLNDAVLALAVDAGGNLYAGAASPRPVVQPLSTSPNETATTGARWARA